MKRHESFLPLLIACVVLVRATSIRAADDPPPFVNYPAPPGVPASADYAVTVNGQPVFTYQTLPPDSVSYRRHVHPSFAYFDHEGPVEVEITSLRPITNLAISPKELNLPHAVEGDRIRLTLPRPMKLVIEADHRRRTLDDHVYRPLILIGNPLETARPDRADPKVVWFKGGQVHILDQLPIEDGTTIYIEGGAVVRSRIKAGGKQGWKILGRGILDGQDFTGGNWNWIMKNEDIRLEGIIAIHGFQWNHPIYNTGGVAIHNYKVISNRGGDGFDFCGCQRVSVTDSLILSNDDNISIKINRLGIENNEDYTIAGSLFWNTDRGHAFVIGGELNNHRDPTGHVRRVVFRDNTILTARMSLDIFNSDHCEISDILYENVAIEDNDCQGHRNYFIKLESRNQAKYGNQDSPGGPIHGVRFKDIRFLGPELPDSIINARDNPITFVVFENVTILGKAVRAPEDFNLKILVPENTRDLRFE